MPTASAPTDIGASNPIGSFIQHRASAFATKPDHVRVWPGANPEMRKR
jgi:hypothetical protein